MQAFLDVVRQATLPAVWSQGVKLTREKSVMRVTMRDHEVTLRVRAPGHAIAPTVTLYLDDEEWACDCGGKVDPCAHVVAASIAWSNGQMAESVDAASPSKHKGSSKAQAASVSVAETLGRLEYRFTAKQRRLLLDRVVVTADGQEHKLISTLSSSLAQRKGWNGFEPTHEDLLVDRILGAPIREMVPVARIADIFRALATSNAAVRFEGQAFRVSGELVMPRAVVEDGPGGGFILRIEAAAGVESVVSMGVARVNGALRPLGEVETTGEFLEKLPLKRTFSKDQNTELVTLVLPELEKRLRVEVLTKRLPKAALDARPRIAMDLSHHGHTLSVLPSLVYGDPAIARIDADNVVPIGRKRRVPLRRRDEERQLVQRLRSELDLVPGRRVDFDGSDAVKFAAKLRNWQARTGDEDRAMVFDDTPLVPRLVTADDGTFEVLFEFPVAPSGSARADREAGDDDLDDLDDLDAALLGASGLTGSPKGARRADAALVLRAWRDGLDLVPLDGGGWASLPHGWLEQHGHRISDLLAARDETTKKLPKSAFFDLGALCADLELPQPKIADKLAPLVQTFDKIDTAALPGDLTASLRPYQQTGVDWLAFLRKAELGAILADDMGLGKTLQTICTIAGRTLVVCPKSVVYNWAAEIARFRPSLKTAVYHGTERELDETADVTLTTYAVLRLDVARLASLEWDMIVLDEAQAIKNDSSQTARAAFQLRGKFRVALSGTPVENRLDELWSLMHFANPGLLGGRGDFHTRYSGPIAVGEPNAAQRLRSKIRPFTLRRMKRDVLPDLPPRTEAVLHVELDETERVIYDAVRAATKKDILAQLGQDGSGRGNVLAALEALLRLRQAACHPSLVPGQRALSSSKIERLLEALEEVVAGGHKALVFSQWTSLLDLVEPHLSKASIGFTRLDGSTRDRGSVVDTFQHDDGPPVMLVSLKAGGTGLNLTAADHVFLLDPWWNPAVEDQAADRAHRIGQQRPVVVYRMVAKDTVEERIFALQTKKRALADVALGDANHAGGITREELLALLD